MLVIDMHALQSNAVRGNLWMLFTNLILFLPLDFLSFISIIRNGFNEAEHFSLVSNRNNTS